MCDKTNKKDDRYEFLGVKLAHELMVDIMGALIPGALFLFCAIVCIVFPIICYSSKGNSFGFLMKDGDWFWIVAFLSFLILSYVVGMIFYRADIKVPDRADIRREQEKKIMAFINGLPKDSEHRCRFKFKLSKKERESKKGYKTELQRHRIIYSANLLLREIKPLLADSEKDTIPNEYPYGDTFQKCCAAMVKFLNELIKDVKGNRNFDFDGIKRSRKYNEFCKQLLFVLFPESADKSGHDFANAEIDMSTHGIKRPYNDIAKKLFENVSHLPLSCQSVVMNTVKIVPLINWYKGSYLPYFMRNLIFKLRLSMVNNNCRMERLIARMNSSVEPYNIFMVAYLILHMQNESGCATEKRCDFPYMSYYKYLLKRKHYDLLKYVEWTTQAARTKNKINLYKIKLQLNEPNAYSIISKNESHIRMAASSWYVARLIKFISSVSLLVTLAFCVVGYCYHSGDISLNGLEQSITCRENQDYSGIKDAKYCCENIVIRQKECSKPGAREVSEFMTYIEPIAPFITTTKFSNELLAPLFPFLTLLLSIYILRCVPRFIHYQRLREIFYTITTFSLWEEARATRSESAKTQKDLKTDKNI